MAARRFAMGHGRGRPRDLGTIVLLALLAGCSATSATPPAGSPPAASTSTAPSTPSTPSSSGASLPPETPWQHELENLKPDGTRSLDSALRLFAMAFGPIPGIADPPADPGTVGSASAAVQVIRAHLDELTADQRSTIQADLDVHPTHAPILITPKATATGTGIELAAFHPQATAAPPPATLGYGADFAQLLESQMNTIADDAAQLYGVNPVIHLDLYDDPSQHAMSYYSVDDAGCSVAVNEATVQPDMWNGRRSVAFDVVHCYQVSYGLLNGIIGQSAPAWAWDGPAEWILLGRFPPGDADSAAWQRYFEQPDRSLFERDADAIGFFAEVESVARQQLDLGRVFRAITLEISNEARYQAFGAATPAFEDVWASMLARTNWSDHWQFDGPGIPGRTVGTPRQPIVMSSGAVEVIDQAPYTNQLFRISSTADIVEVDMVGHSRVGDSSFDTTELSPGYFCATDRGCGPCPDGSAPSIDRTRLDEDPLMGVSGGTDGTTGTVSGHDLEEYCNHASPSPDAQAVQVKKIVSEFGTTVTIVDLVSCDGPWGHWTGQFYGLAKVDRPMDFTVGSGAGDVTLTVTPGAPAVSPHGAISVSGDVDVTIQDDGTTMVLSGTTDVVWQGANGPLPTEHHPFSVAYQIEPADPGRCP